MRIVEATKKRRFPDKKNGNFRVRSSNLRSICVPFKEVGLAFYAWSKLMYACYMINYACVMYVCMDLLLLSYSGNGDKVKWKARGPDIPSPFFPRILVVLTLFCLPSLSLFEYSISNFDWSYSSQRMQTNFLSSFLSTRKISSKLLFGWTEATTGQTFAFTG